MQHIRIRPFVLRRFDLTVIIFAERTANSCRYWFQSTFIPAAVSASMEIIEFGKLLLHRSSANIIWQIITAARFGKLLLHELVHSLHTMY